MASFRIALLLALIAACAVPALGQISASSSSSSAATQYLQAASDRYQSTVDVYSDADAAGNHFAARGEIHSQNGPVTPPMDEISSAAQCFGITCITAQFNSSGKNWGGWYFQNGVLGATDRTPSLNWGTNPGAGYDLSGATSLQFWARGAVGGEVVEFFAFGIGYDPDSGAQTAPYPDSARKASTGPVTLSTSWIQYTIPLTGLDVHYVLGGFGWVASASSQAGGRQSISFFLDNIQYQKARPADSRFLVSYETIKSDNPFDVVERNAAFLYDNAVALIALVAAGDLVRARTIADSMVYAQIHDRYFKDHRLRNAYQGGDFALPPGWLPNNNPATARMPGWYDGQRTAWFEDETQVSSNTGNIAWAMLGLLSYYDATKDPNYLAAVDLLGNWVIANTSDTRGNGGFTGGYDGWENGSSPGSGPACASGVYVQGQCKRLYKATEHNIDLYAAFSRLYKIEGLAQWLQAAQQARTFFLSMWDPVEEKFYTGTDEGGINASTSVIPLDIQVWSLEALGADAGPYLHSLDYVEAHHKTELGYGFKQDGGNTCGDTTWFEGTSQVALAYFLTGNTTKWQSILSGIHSAQLPSGAMPATDGQCLNTGFTLNDGQPWEYFPRAHVGATGWLSLAEQGVNPFGADSYSPGPRVQISPVAIDFPGQDVGSASAPSSITLTNTGSAQLTLSNVSIGGTNPQDFLAQSGSTCVAGAMIPAAGACSIGVVFNPAATGSQSALITVADNALGNPQTIAVSGSGMDFTIGVSSGGSSTQNVTQGSPATYSLSLSPVGEFNETVSLACRIQSQATGPMPTCSFSPSAPKLDGANSSPVVLTIATSFPGSSKVQSPLPVTPENRAPLALGLLVFLAPSLFIRCRGARRSSGPYSRAVRCLVASTFLLFLVSCGGSGSKGGSGGGGGGTQSAKGTYSIDVNASHGSLQHSTSLTLTIN